MSSFEAEFNNPVFILLMEEYPGVSIMGVHSTLKAAKQHKAAWRRVDSLYSDLWIEKWDALKDYKTSIFAKEGTCQFGEVVR